MKCAKTPAPPRRPPPRPPRRGPLPAGPSPQEVEDALGVVLAEIDEISKATFRSITLATMLKLVTRRRK